MKVKKELSQVPGISDLSGRRVQWGVMEILRGAPGGHELHDTIIRRLHYFGISSARRGLRFSFLTLLLSPVLSSLLFSLI